MSAGNGNSSTIEIAQSEQVIDTKKNISNLIKVIRKSHLLVFIKNLKKKFITFWKLLANNIFEYKFNL